MEKRKINFEKYADMHQEKTFKGIDENEITVRNHISYSDKEKFARELLEKTIVIHDDSCVYMSDQIEKMKYYLVAKYYTDIDTDDVDPNDIIDFMINTDIMNPIKEYIGNDVDFITDMYFSMYDALCVVYADDNSLSKAMRTSFSFLFNGEDITQTIAEAEASKNKVYEAFKLLAQSEKEKAETIDNGTVKIDGNIINFAKKKV